MRTFGQVIDQGIRAVAAGQSHSMVLDDNGALWGTGENGFGQLGVGTTDDKFKFTKVVIPSNDDGACCEVQYVLDVYIYICPYICSINSGSWVFLGCD